HGSIRGCGPESRFRRTASGPGRPGPSPARCPGRTPGGSSASSFPGGGFPHSGGGGSDQGDPGASSMAWRPPCTRRLFSTDPAARRRLVEYNLYDVFHLKPLAELGYNRLLKRTGMPAVPLEVTDRGAMLYDVSRAVEAACS